MRSRIASLGWRLSILGLGTVALLSCACSKTPPAIDFAMTGRVLDKDTMQPIEGAYVLAIYRSQRAGYAAVVSHCTKSRGMVTGKDGRFSFPVERLDGYSPLVAQAISLDYVSQSDSFKPESIRIKQNADSYSDRDIHLEKQQPGEKFSRVGTQAGDCVYASNPKDAAAAAEFLRIERAQYIKYEQRKDMIEMFDKQIRRLESLDGRMPDEIREEAVVPPTLPPAKQ